MVARAIERCTRGRAGLHQILMKGVTAVVILNANYPVSAIKFSAFAA